MASATDSPCRQARRRGSPICRESLPQQSMPWGCLFIGMSGTEAAGNALAHLEVRIAPGRPPEPN
jgi:hypothetical protein